MPSKKAASTSNPSRNTTKHKFILILFRGFINRHIQQKSPPGLVGQASSPDNIKTDRDVCPTVVPKGL